MHYCIARLDSASPGPTSLPPSSTVWRCAHQADPLALALADRHYSRSRPGSRGMMPPGRQLVLVSTCGRAVWGTSWPAAELVRRPFPTAWVCTIFRNESPELLSSDLIRQALAITRWRWPVVPGEGTITFVNPLKVRHKRDPGRCFRRAGFMPAGQTLGGLIILHLPAEATPPAMPPVNLPTANGSHPHDSSSGATRD